MKIGDYVCFWDLDVCVCSAHGQITVFSIVHKISTRGIISVLSHTFPIFSWPPGALQLGCPIIIVTDKNPFYDHFLAVFLPATFISFTKLRFRRPFWGAEQVWIFYGSKAMTQNANISIFVPLRFCKKTLICVVIFAFWCVFVYIITFEPIKV